jgi:hypothetical protein
VRRFFRTGLGCLTLGFFAQSLPLPFHGLGRAVVALGFLAPLIAGLVVTVQAGHGESRSLLDIGRSWRTQTNRYAYRFVPALCFGTAGLIVIAAVLGAVHWFWRSPATAIGTLVLLGGALAGLGALLGGGVAASVAPGVSLAGGGGGGRGRSYPCPDDKLWKKGMIICPTCEEIGKVGNDVCPRCRGSKYVMCPRCQGSGVAHD